MPAYARRQLADPSSIETHHVWSRCVGRMWLMGVDPLTGIDYSYRRHWVESLHEYYAGVFAIDQANQNIMSNHLHGVHRTRPDIAATWADDEVCWRWKRAWPTFKDGVWQRTPNKSPNQDTRIWFNAGDLLAAQRQPVVRLASKV